MSQLWEVDPETRSKLQTIQKTNGNNRCCDCDAPSPQWASPKFGTFICLNCAGTHRGLGVQISFVRSITMDSFKLAEIQRMELGGNKPWKDFFDSHSITVAEGTSFEDATVKERYSGDVGEEWRERLTAKVEGKEYVPSEKKPRPVISRSSASTPRGFGRDTPERNPLSRSQSAAPGAMGDEMGGINRKEANEAYFSRLNEANAQRLDGISPAQGGKYAGFGGGMPPPAPRRDEGAPALDEFQNDPVAALTKGFGWFTATVGKSAKAVNDTYIQPAAKTIAESEFAAQARVAAGEVSRNIQSGTRGAADTLTRFVEGPDGPEGRSRSTTSRVEPERKDFWDSFGASNDPAPRGSGSIGTGAMKKSNTTSGSAIGGTGSTKPKQKDDGWDW
ncbi:Zn finger-containing GTPase- Activating Protein for ARF [Myotisia sp. PD_48]|nr:Zn finger-containing GTPase- Activating Protein for ARF [Myotisia sp. PD_48]